MKETTQNDAVQCPHCLHIHRDTRDFGLSDGDAQEMECEACLMPFIASLDVTYTYHGKPLPPPPATGEAG
jgi:hypothetical protein